MIAELNKDLDVTLTLCHGVSRRLHVCVYVSSEVVSSHPPAAV